MFSNSAESLSLDLGVESPTRRLDSLRSSELEAIPVSAFLTQVNGVIGEIFSRVWIQGEVTGLKVAASGHVYFSLKDDAGQIKCTLFASQRQNNRPLFTEGAKLEIQGSCSIYKARGDFQMNVLAWRLTGEGELYAKFLALKARLEAEGLFLPTRKKALPSFVRTVVLLTSRHGAAVHDVVATIQRRTPWIRIIFGNVLVQGSDAPQSCIRALRVADHVGADAILLVRGGGSFEDLNAFNNERLARRIVRLQTPSIVAIGHESDTTIAELVADHRASTPTAAAESLTATQRFWLQKIQNAQLQLHTSTQRILAEQRFTLNTARQSLDRIADSIERLRQRVQLARSRILSPAQQIQHAKARLKNAQNILMQNTQQFLRQKEVALQRIQLTPLVQNRYRQLSLRLENAKHRYPNPQDTITRAENLFQEKQKALQQNLDIRIQSYQEKLKHIQKTLEAFHPDRPLRWGYAHIFQNNQTITSVHDVQPQQNITIRFHDGRIQTKVLDS